MTVRILHSGHLFIDLFLKQCIVDGEYLISSYYVDIKSSTLSIN